MGDVESDCLSGDVQHPAAVSRAVQQLLAKHRNRTRTSSTSSNGNEPLCVDQPAQWHTSTTCKSTHNLNLNWELTECRFETELKSNDNSTASSGTAPTTDVNGNEDEAESDEALSKLRCQSVRTEIIAEKYRRKNRCADYPGFAFGSSVFSSDTMMKFNIIKNELHNIMHNQLKRVSNTHSMSRVFYTRSKKGQCQNIYNLSLRTICFFKG